MWTRNYYNILNAQRNYSNVNNGASFASGAPSAYAYPITARSCHATQYKYYNLPGNLKSYSALNLNQIDSLAGLGVSSPLEGPATERETIGVGIGSGDTPVTFDDYKLDTPLDGWHLHPTQPIDYNTAYDSTSRKYVTTIAIRIEASYSMTVREIGLSICPGCNNAFMIYREVLASPVQLAAGDVLRVTIKCDAPVLSPYDYE